MNCLNCDKPVEQTKGKRQRKYCNDLCRATHAQQLKKLKKNVAILIPLTGHVVAEMVEKKKPEVTVITNKKTLKDMPSGLSTMEQLIWRSENL